MSRPYRLCHTVAKLKRGDVAMRLDKWLMMISLLCLMNACSSEPATTNKNEATPPSPPASTDADNTARNADPSVLNQTATAQSESQADITISSAIRKAVVADSALSVNAHNVKIITADGVVTLQGPVKSDKEKQSIEAKAKQVAGVKSVANLLEVEKNP